MSFKCTRQVSFFFTSSNKQSGFYTTTHKEKDTETKPGAVLSTEVYKAYKGVSKRRKITLLTYNFNSER